MKRYLKIIFIAFFLVCFLPAINVKASSLDMDQLSIDAYVNSDGSMDVTEKWTLYVDEVNTLYKNWNLDSSRFSGISDVSVKDLDTGKNFEEIDEEMYHVTTGCFYALPISGNKFEVAWGTGLEDSSETKKYELRYKVNDAVAIHNDCAEIYWKFIGENFDMPIDKIEGVIHLPGNISKEDIRVWGHTDTLSGTIYPTEESSVIFELKNIPSKEFVEIRSTFPKESVSYSKRMDDENVLSSIIEEETTWANEANARREKYNSKQKLVFAGMLIAEALLAITEFSTSIKVIKRNTKKIRPHTEYEYFRDLPREDATPLESAILLNCEKMYMNKPIFDFGNVFSATLMDLNLKKYLKFELDAENKDNVTIIPDKDIDSSILKKDEKLIYDFVLKACKDKESISMKELQRYIENHTNATLNLKNEITNAGKEFIEDEDYTNSSEVNLGNIIKIKSILPSFLIIFLFSYFSYLISKSEYQLIIAGLFIVITIISIILSKIAMKKLNPFTQLGEDEINKWKAFKKFMNDFSTMDKKDLPSIVIWEHYLVFATAFGMAKKVIKQLKLVYPEINEENSFDSYSTIYLISNTDFTGNFSKAINSSMSSTYSSGSGSGGGFSSGGGGGGGSGGGGGR